MDCKQRFLILCLLSHFSLKAQLYNKPDHDTTYYRSFKGTIIGRVYLSRNYFQYKLEPPDGSLSRMSYHANTPLSLGVGLTYKSLSFSFSKGLNFLQSKSTKGDTRSTDLQLHLYKRKWTVDAIGEFYRGYYLSPGGLAAPDGKAYYIRPDMTVKLVGTSVYRVLNDKKFCYSAGLSQNAWQQRSAGSFLLGGEAFYLAIRADSAFAPRQVDSNYNNRNIHKLHLFEIGPGIGYAYTLVIKKHYFLLGSFNTNINLRVSREVGNSTGVGNLGFSPNYMLRFCGGYNTSRWGISLMWLTTGVTTKGNASDYQYAINTGNYRLVYARRLAINRKMKAILGSDLY